MPEKYDVIVLGLGAFGAATLYQLARRGVKVLGIDRYAPPHTLGSTHGETRITRLACGEGPVYTQFARRSHELWRQFEQESGRKLLVQNGLLVISGPGKRASAHGKNEFLQATIDVANENDVAYETMDASVVRERFPAFNIRDDERAYYEPEAGFVFPEECVGLQIEFARKAGAAVQFNETVGRFAPQSGAVEIVTDRGAYSGDRLVVTAGPWLPQLVPSWSRLFTIRRQVLAWFRIDESKLAKDNYLPDRFPVFYWQVPREQAIYGFPWIGIGAPAVKLASEQYHSSTTPETVDRDVSPEEIALMHRDYVADFFPGLTDDCVRSAVCLYTCTDDAHFIIDILPDNPRVIVASPCSGHGFKHSPSIGEAIARLATGDSAEELEPFGLPA